MKRHDHKYGSKDWFVRAYDRVPDDPWGLEWRLSQRLRYVTMLEALEKSLGRAADQGLILDVGCATGDFTFALSQHFPRATVIGSDFVDAAVDRAKSRFPSVRFEVSTIMDACATHSSTIDAVTCLEVLYYLSPGEQLQALASFRESLKNGGILLASSVVGPSPYFSRERLVDLIRSADFQIVGVGSVAAKLLSYCEKAALRLPLGFGRRAARLMSSFENKKWALHGASGLGKLSSALLGRAAESHVFVVARKSSLTPVAGTETLSGLAEPPASG